MERKKIDKKSGSALTLPGIVLAVYRNYYL